MPEKNVVPVPSAPLPLAHYARVTTHKGLIFCSGIAATGSRSDAGFNTFQERSRYVLDSLRSVLEASGSSLNHVLKVNIYLTRMGDYAEFNQVWDEFFINKEKPARTCVAVYQLPRSSDVEIEATAYIP